MLEHQTTALVLLDAALHVVYANNAAEQLLTVSGTRMAGQPLDDFFPDPQQSTRELEQALAESQSFTRRQVPFKLQNGDSITVDYTVTPMPHQPRGCTAD